MKLPATLYFCEMWFPKHRAPNRTTDSASGNSTSRAQRRQNGEQTQASAAAETRENSKWAELNHLNMANMPTLQKLPSEVIGFTRWHFILKAT